MEKDRITFSELPSGQKGNVFNFFKKKNFRFLLPNFIFTFFSYQFYFFKFSYQFMQHYFVYIPLTDDTYHFLCHFVFFFPSQTRNTSGSFHNTTEGF